MGLLKRWKYKKAVQYLENIDYSTLIQYSEKIQSYHINETMDFPLGETAIFHHLPLKDKDDDYLAEDNWDLPDEAKKEIHELVEKLREYYDAIYTVRYYTSKGKFNLYGTPFVHEVLPPWIVFPHYGAMSLGWRMGAGEEYMEIYISYINSLSDERYEAYTNTYPVPEYMRINSFGFNFMNYYARKKYEEEKI